MLVTAPAQFAPQQGLGAGAGGLCQQPGGHQQLLPILAPVPLPLSKPLVWVVPVEGDTLLQGWGDAARVFH